MSPNMTGALLMMASMASFTLNDALIKLTGGAVPLWGGEVAKKVKYLNQGGSVWVFKLPKELASGN